MNDKKEYCDACQSPGGLDALLEREQQLLQKYGWYSHFVPEDANYHTHGLSESSGHPDFQIIFPINPNGLHALAAKIVDRVKNGERFTDGMRVSGIVKDYEVLLVEAQEAGRQVLRIILPDKNGNLEESKLSGTFAAQFQDLQT